MIARDNNGRFIKGSHPSSEFGEGYIPWNKGLHTGLVPKTAFGKSGASYKQGFDIDNSNFIHGKRCHGAQEPYSPEFMKVRKIVIERDNHTCRMCGKKGKDVHHIDLDKDNNEISNLILLCKPCHSSSHGKYIEKEMISVIRGL